MKIKTFGRQRFQSCNIFIQELRIEYNNVLRKKVQILYAEWHLGNAIVS